MEIYAESLFLVNFSAVYICLAPTVGMFKIKKIRHLCAAVIGAVCSCFAFSFGSVIITAAGYILTAMAAFGKNARAWAVFFTTVFLMYAIFSLVLSAFGTEAVIQGGVIYFNLSAKIFFPALAFVYPIVIALEKLQKSALKRQIHTLKITKNNKTVSLTALYDSGNLLTEPKTGQSVILVSQKALSPLDTDKIISEEPIVIPYRSLGHDGVILGFSVDEIILDKNKEVGAVIGIGKERSFGGCDALIGGI